MNLTSVIKAPENAITIGIAEAVAVYAIYQAALPAHTDIRAADPHNTDVEASRKRAAWMSAGVLGLVFLMTRDVNSFLIGGFTLAGVDFMVKHANAVHPATGKMAGPSDFVQADNDVAFPLNDVTDSLADDSVNAY